MMAIIGARSEAAPLCVLCPHALRSPAGIVIFFPSVEKPTSGIAIGLCETCATQPTQTNLSRVATALGLRTLDVAALRPGGHA
jgi:hypothetical protein